MPTFKQRRFVCGQCDRQVRCFAWDYDPAPVCADHGPLHEDSDERVQAHGVVDDTIIGGRWCETLGHEPVWIESHSQLRREAEKRGLVNVVKHDDAYYAKRRRMHDEELRDTGRNVEY